MNFVYSAVPDVPASTLNLELKTPDSRLESNDASAAQSSQLRPDDRFPPLHSRGGLVKLEL